jgi:8-oxo-dGTP diphosphatase
MSETSPTEERRFLEGQRLQPERYAVIPRTLTFLTREGQVLLVRVPEGRGAWAGRYNGLGGHIERGEDALTSARREVEEESGLQLDRLDFVGVVLIDTAKPSGIGLLVFSADAPPGPIRSGAEGDLAWIDLARLDGVPLVEDLPVLLPRVLQARATKRPFFGSYRFDAAGRVHMEFVE